MRAAILHSILAPGREEDYDRAHRVIPDDLMTLLRGAGVRDWAIWREGRDLLHVIDTDDYDAVTAAIAGDPADVRWQEQMAELVEGFTELSTVPALRSPRLVWSMSEQVAR